MLIKVFKNVGKGPSKGPINYLLGKDAEGKERSIKPRIFQGSKDATAFLIDQNHRANKYTSGVIAFRNEEKPSFEQLKEMCEDFQKTFMPTMSDDDVPVLWVMHQEKGNTELHFLIPKQTSKGKAFNAFPPGAKNMELMKAWQQIQNDKMGFKQVTSDGFTQSFDVFEKKTRKPQFAKKIKALAKSGKINNRSDLIKFMQSQGHKVTRAGDDYISIKFSDKDKAIRFQGEMFKASADYQKMLNTRQEVDLNRLDRAVLTNKIEQLKKVRTDFNLKAYHSPKKPRFQNTQKRTSPFINGGTSKQPRLSSAFADKQPLKTGTLPTGIGNLTGYKPSNGANAPTPLLPQKNPSMTSLEAKGDSSLPKSLPERSEQAPATQQSFNFDKFKDKLSSFSSSSSNSSSSLASIDSQISALIAEMTGIKDPVKIAELQQKIAVLTARKIEQAHREKNDIEKRNSKIKLK